MTSTPLAGLRILVVEDEVMIADDVADDLRERGASVLGPAASLEQAEALIEGGDRIDAAVLDVNLRGQMVYDLADRLIERGVPVVFATGYSQFVIPERFRSVPRCEKPLKTSDLEQALRRVPI